jgi:arsenite oxidase small subunit
MTQDAGDQSGSPTVSRRNFIEGLGFATGGVAIGLLVGAGIPAVTGDDDGAPRIAAPQPTEEPTVIVEPTVVPAVATAHPRVRVASLGELEVGQPVDFAYPTEQAPVSLIKLGRRADGGIGPDGDIVAFGTDCTHMGCPLRGAYKPEYGILGPCGCHFTTFDLAHRGMVVLGQATQNLPQVILELDGDDINAVGTLGIMYGFRDNLADAPIVDGL